MNVFNEEFKVNFFKDNFGKKYLFKPGIINNYNNDIFISEDLPTLGRPIIPQLTFILIIFFLF